MKRVPAPANVSAGSPRELRLRVYAGPVIAMGPGKADLLEAIERDGSISAAGRTLGMSYRRTWILVDEMNRCFREKLVETLTGGGKQRGARLTEAGRLVLKSYRELEAESVAATDSECCRVLAEMVREEPLKSKLD